MTRIFSEGAEMGDTLFWDYVSNAVTAETASPVPYESGWCFKMKGYVYKVITAIDECYMRERMYFYYPYETTPNCFPKFMSGSTALAWVAIDSSFHPYAATSSGTLETATETVNANQWYQFEVYFKLADAPNGRFTVKMDGVTIIDFTGDTKPGAQTTFDRILWQSSQGAVGVRYVGIDDLAFNDTAGGSDDSWCGDGVIIKVYPNADGAHNNWHGSDGNDVNNFELVDEFPKDNDTTYVYHDGAISGTQDQYGLSDYDGTDKTITRIWAEARIRKTASALHTVKVGFLASGGTDDMSAAQNLSTTYSRVLGDEATVNPVDSGVWEEADIDALQFVVEVG